MSHSLASLFFLSRDARKSVLRGKIVNLARQDSQSWHPTLTVLRCKKVNLAMQNSQSCIVFPAFLAVRDIRFAASDAATYCLTESCGKRRRIVCTPPAFSFVCIQTFLVRRKSSQPCCSVKFRRPLRPVFCAACVPYRAGAGGEAQCGYGTERKKPARLCRVVCQCDMPCCGRCVSQRISCCPLPRQRLSSCC